MIDLGIAAGTTVIAAAITGLYRHLREWHATNEAMHDALQHETRRLHQQMADLTPPTLAEIQPGALRRSISTGIQRDTVTGELFIPVRQAAMSGAHVIQTRGLADGYIPPPASLDPPPPLRDQRKAERVRAESCGQTAPFLGVTAAEAAVNLKIALGHCPHGLAEEVVLITGEVVAAVCPTCWATLPPSFVGSAWKP